MYCNYTSGLMAAQNEEMSGMTSAGDDHLCHADDEDVPILGVDPRENLKMKPKKSILKTSSIEHSNPPILSTRDISPGRADREAHFDEMNILATHHPPDKDYGHMKIDEPKTPYSYTSDSESDDVPGDRVRRVSLTEKTGRIDAKRLQEKLALTKDNASPEESAAEIIHKHTPGSSDEEEEELDEEGKAHRRAFEMKRKQHYNEGRQMKLARDLLQKELADLAKDDDEDSNAPPPAMETS